MIANNLETKIAIEDLERYDRLNIERVLEEQENLDAKIVDIL